MKLLLKVLVLALALVGTLLFYLKNKQMNHDLALARSRYQKAEERNGELSRRVGELKGELGSLQANLSLDRESRHSNDLVLERLEKKLARRQEEKAPPLDKAGQAKLAAIIQLQGTLNRLLARSGYSRVRIFSIGESRDQALHDVALHHLGRDGIVSEAVRLEVLYLTLDPAHRELRFDSPRGRKLTVGKWVDFGPTGWRLTLPEVDPAIWEKLAFGFLKVLPRPEIITPKLDLQAQREAQILKQRINTLLKGEAGLEGNNYRLMALKSLVPGGFSGIEILGYSARGRLAERFSGERMRVETLTGGGVRLILEKGCHENNRGKSPFPPTGYALYLSGAEAAAWERALPGRVVAARR